MKRPKIKDFFPEDAGVADAHKEYMRSPHLYSYMNALDSYVDHLETLMNKEQEDKLSVATMLNQGESAGNQTPSTETPPSSTKEGKDLVIETSMESVVKFETEVERLKKENVVLRGALGRLVSLKDYKDKNGKDELYEQTQPQAWEQAREALSQINKGEPGT